MDANGVLSRVYDETTGALRISGDFPTTAEFTAYQAAVAAEIVALEDAILGLKNSSRTALDTTEDRQSVVSNVSVTSTAVHWTMFTALVDMVATGIEYETGSTAAASITNIQYGLFAVNAAGTSLTPLAITEHDATLLVGTTTVYPKSFSAIGSLPASVLIEKGQRYATALTVEAGTPPNIRGYAGTSGTGARLPLLNGFKGAAASFTFDGTATPLTSAGAGANTMWSRVLGTVP